MRQLTHVSAQIPQSKKEYIKHLTLVSTEIAININKQDNVKQLKQDSAKKG